MNLTGELRWHLDNDHAQLNYSEDRLSISIDQLIVPAAFRGRTHQVLGEPGEPFGVVILHNERGKLMLMEGELRGQAYSVLLLLAADVN